MIARKAEDHDADRAKLCESAQLTADEQGEAVLVMLTDNDCTGMREPSQRLPFYTLLSQATKWQEDNAWKRIEPTRKEA